jgi:NAD-dependent SIR2 family protein deacetylase
MQDLIDVYKKKNLILFVGAGVSMNIGLPSWDALISEIATQLGYSPEVFSTYGDNLALAEYYKIKKGNVGKLRSYMDVEWHRSMNTKDSTIFKAIAEGNFPIIYTTNYDRSLEQAHNENGVPYNKIVDVEDIVQIDASKRQIVKYHGDFQNDDSLVLAESDYYARLQFV